MELWLPFLPWLTSQSGAGTSLGQGDGCSGHGWWQVLFYGRTWRAVWSDVLESLNPWLSGFMQPSISPRHP